MPYNTRRKSLSLPSLGIQLPPSSRAFAANRSPPSVAAADQPPTKKSKRSHASPSPTSPVHTDRPRHALKYEHTPPPSPEPAIDGKVDTEGINDEVVTGVIQQLEKTGNKPQLIKELAAVLCNTLDIVESSANPQAIISSRLNAYLKRPWTALSPCPLAKTLIPTHPRRIYFYLTNIPHQDIPASSSESPLPSNRRTGVISPSLSSEEDHETRKRAELSPSPEVDLSVPDLDEEQDFVSTPDASFGGSGRSSLARDGTHASVGSMDGISHSNRAVSPPLEGDEREFTQTASQMQVKRSMSLDQPLQHDGDTVRASTENEDGEGHAVNMSVDESDEHAELRNSEAAAALFGHAHRTAAAMAGLSSPVSRPTTLSISTTVVSPKKVTFVPKDAMEVDRKGDDVEGSSGFGLSGWANEMVSPEKVELEELDDLLGGF